MATVIKKTTPAYTTQPAFDSIIKDLRENGTPTHITRGVARGSNSGRATMVASLKFLGLIEKDGEATDKLRQLVDTPEDYSENIKKLLEEKYSLLFDGSIDIKNTVTEKLAEKFEAAGASGSTVSKCMAFFLGMAKVAKIEVSPRVKVPSTPSAKRRKNGTTPAVKTTARDTDDEPSDEIPEGMERITVPLRGMEDGVIYFPEGLDDDSAKRAIKMTVFILREYYGLPDEQAP